MRLCREYAVPHALAVFDLMGASETVVHARAVLKWVRNRAQPSPSSPSGIASTGAATCSRPWPNRAIAPDGVDRAGVSAARSPPQPDGPVLGHPVVVLPLPDHQGVAQPVRGRRHLHADVVVEHSVRLRRERVEILVVGTEHADVVGRRVVPAVAVRVVAEIARAPVDRQLGLGERVGGGRDGGVPAGDVQLGVQVRLFDLREDVGRPAPAGGGPGDRGRVAEAGGELVVGVVVAVQGQPDLLEVVGALGPRARPRGPSGRRAGAGR